MHSNPEIFASRWENETRHITNLTIRQAVVEFSSLFSRIDMGIHVLDRAASGFRRQPLASQALNHHGFLDGSGNATIMRSTRKHIDWRDFTDNCTIWMSRSIDQPLCALDQSHSSPSTCLHNSWFSLMLRRAEPSVDTSATCVRQMCDVVTNPNSNPGSWILKKWSQSRDPVAQAWPERV